MLPDEVYTCAGWLREIEAIDTALRSKHQAVLTVSEKDRTETINLSHQLWHAALTVKRAGLVSALKRQGVSIEGW